MLSDKQKTYEEMLKEHPNSFLILEPSPDKKYGGMFVFNFPVFCTNLKDGYCSAETDLLFDDGKIRRISFPKLSISSLEGETVLELKSGTVFKILGEVEKGRTAEDYLKGNMGVIYDTK